MCNVYDRAVCATELTLRDNILNKIDGGWRPAPAFEIPNSQTEGGAPVTQEECVESSEESTSETSTAEDVKNQRINDITQLND